MVVYRAGDQPRRRLVEALLHEFTHIYIHRVFEKTEPLWLMEGLAEYFGRFDVSTGKLRVGLSDEKSVSALKESLERGGWLPIRRLLDMERDDFYGLRSRQAYVQSWILVRTLMGKRIRRCLTSDEPNVELLDLTQLEKEVQAHLKELK